jgi:5-carboxymethyl-2-hydroxymuconate isomerase
MPHLTIQATPNVSISHEEAFLKSLNKVLWDSGHFGQQTRNQLAELLMSTIEEILNAEQSGRAALQICVEVEEISAVYHKKMLGR